MFPTLFNGQTVYVLDDAWNGNSAFKMDVAVLRDTQASLTKREARRPYSITLRVPKLKFETTVHDSALRKLQGALRDITTEPVVVPLWPAITRWADRAAASISGGLKIVWKEDWSQFEIYTTVEPGWPAADDNFAAALLGFLNPTEPDMLNPDAVTWQVEFVESSPADYALVPVAFVPGAGPQPVGYSFAPPLLPFLPDFTNISENISVEFKHTTQGFTREQSLTFYPQASARSQKADYTLTNLQAGQFLRFLQDVAAPGASFWASGWIELARLTQDALATDTVLHVEDTNAVKVGDYVSFYTIQNTVARKITAKSANTITLNSAVGIPLSTVDALIFPLCLASMDKPSFTLAWKSPAVAHLQFNWTEVPAELIPASDETVGTTLGQLPVRVVLFQFTRDYRNGTLVSSYFTNYEKILTWNSQTWASKNISCSDVTRGLNLEEDGLDITTEKFTGNPLIEDLTKRAEVPLTLTIRVGDFDGTTVSNVVTKFTGSVTAPSRNGNTIKAKCRFGPAVLDNQFPFFINGPVCSYLRGNNPDGSFLISPGCTLPRADWKFTAQVVAPVSAAFPFALYLNNLVRVTGAAPTYFANWFAGGYIEWGAGANIQRRYLTGSSNPLAGSLSVNLHRYFVGAPAIGDSIVLYPSCDGLASTCRAYDAVSNPTGKFNNHENFGGDEFMPAGNPSFTGQPNLGTSGGKK
jgi:hypothetical protein